MRLIAAQLLCDAGRVAIAMVAVLGLISALRSAELGPAAEMAIVLIAGLVSILVSDRIAPAGD